MDMFSVLVPILARPLAKHLAKEFFGEPADDVADGVLEMLSRHIRDSRQRRDATRQFEDLAERIVARLAPTFEDRGGAVAVEAVAHEVATTIATHTSAPLLIQHRLDPSELNSAFRTLRPLPRNQFSRDEILLYDTALIDISRYLVEVASHLPHFDSHLAAAQLGQIRRLQDDIEKSLELASQIYQGAVSDPADERDRFELDYRAATLRNLDYLELFGSNLSAECRRHKLTVAFHQVCMIDAASPEPRAADAVLVMLEQQGVPVLLRGEAGGGKSTLLRWVAIQAASYDASSHGKDGGASPEHGARLWRSRIPFLVRLRDCQSGRLPTLDVLTYGIAHELGAPPSGWAKSVLDEGRGLVLFDGVDEVPPKHRRSIETAIEGFVGAYPRARYLLTTRPAAVPRGWMARVGTRELELSPLTDADREIFIDKWHEAIAAELKLIGRGDVRVAGAAQALKAALREMPSVARLASSPLLAAMICALHRDRNRQLPSNQRALVHELVEILLQRDDLSQLNHAEFATAYSRLSADQRRMVAEELAEHMITEGVSALQTADAVGCVRRALKVFPGYGSDDAPAILTDLVERSGMLREPAPDRFDFIHNTFKEYLASRRFVERNRPRTLAVNATDASWTNVLMFAAASPDDRTFAGKLIRAILLGEKQVDKKRTRALRVIAVRLRTVAQALDPETVARVDDFAKTLFPPRTMADAQALADYGDEAVARLKWRKTLSSRQAAASARALRLIGTPFALEALRAYLQDARDDVAMELAQALDPLEVPGIRQAVLSGRLSFDSTVRRRIVDLQALSGLLAEVVTLDLSNTRVADLTHLHSAARLRRLRIDRTPVDDLRPIAGLLSLMSLSIHGCHRIGSLMSLSRMQSLADLHVDGVALAGTEVLAECSSLDRLCVNLARADADVSFALPEKLARIRLMGASGDLRYLRGVAARRLELGADSHVDLRVVREMSDLESLFITARNADFTALAGHESLRTVRINVGRPVGLEVLRTLPRLEKVEFGSRASAERVERLGLPANVLVTAPRGRMDVQASMSFDDD